MLDSLTTVVVDGAHVESRTRSLAELKDDGREMEDHVRSLAASFARAFAPVAADRKILLGLTGGMDSRLILAGALAAELEVDCLTHSFGESNRADVWVAETVARRADVRHRIRDFSADRRAGGATYRKKAIRTLAASDGMLGCQYPITIVRDHRPGHSLSGHGGEILRGGYGEKLGKAKRDYIQVFFANQWFYLLDLCHREVVEEQRAIARSWIEQYPESMRVQDVLDCLYVDRRCGRWVAGSSRASTRKIFPLLDNAVVRAVVAVPASIKRKHTLHRRLLEILLPQVADVPLANKFWFGTPKDAQDVIRETWPEAFAKTEAKATPAPAPALNPEIEAEIKSYVLRGDRLELLSEVLRPGAVRKLLTDPPPNFRRWDRFLRGLYSACLLLSEDWRQAE